jgi:O-antigen/teichoic acid export membrane protein
VSFAGAALGNIASSLLGSVLALFTGVLTARVLGPEGRGIYVLALLVPHFAVNILPLGIGSANAYFVAKRERDARTALATSLSILVPVGLVCAIGMDRVIAWGGSWTVQGMDYVRLTVWSIPFTLAFNVAGHTLLGLQRYAAFNVLNVIDKAILLVLSAAGILAGEGTLGTLCTLFVLASAANCILGMGWVLQASRGALRWDGDYARAALHYGMRGHVGWIAELLTARLDMVVVNALAGAGPLGFYSVAVSLAETIWILPGGVWAVMMPKLAHARSDFSATTALVCRLVFPVTVATAVVLAVASEPVLTLLYGSAFRPALAPLLVLLPGVAVQSLARLLGSDFAARGRPGLNSMIATVALVTTVGFDLLLIPGHGVVGAALARTLTCAIMVVIAVTLYCRTTRIAVGGILLPRAADLRAVHGTLRDLAQRSAAMVASPRSPYADGP